eukprot:TRINITY_DN53162_c0_g1_i2.p2 TRINITY_DN53162_c0_g1~~TRINITY_DN53162_c0_g1_i2.p2  ORF type:complete len:129 (-),score=4.71 TRINITY_DN53162_c0_g1_i2:189-575(-)
MSHPSQQIGTTLWGQYDEDEFDAYLMTPERKRQIAEHNRRAEEALRGQKNLPNKGFPLPRDGPATPTTQEATAASWCVLATSLMMIRRKRPNLAVCNRLAAGKLCMVPWHLAPGCRHTWSWLICKHFV